MDKHTNYGQEGTNNNEKNCAALVTPTDRLDWSVEITTLNDEVKSKDLMVKMCCLSNEDKS